MKKFRVYRVNPKPGFLLNSIFYIVMYTWAPYRLKMIICNITSTRTQKQGGRGDGREEEEEEEEEEGRAVERIKSVVKLEKL